MSEEKTEQATPHKLKESAEKGDSYKSKDAVAAVILIAGVVMLNQMSLEEFTVLYKDLLEHGESLGADYVVDRCFRLFWDLMLPFLGLCMIATVVPSLLQSKFVLAFEAIKLDFDSLNPVNGFKNIFSMKTVKELVKAFLYLIVFSLTCLAFFKFYEPQLLRQIYVQPAAIGSIWLNAATSIVLLCMLAFAIIIVVDGIADLLLYLKQQRMDKHELKEEHKELEGNPEVKGRRKEMREELLSGQDKVDIEQSNFILANPTHIAIGIYVNMDAAPLPLVSILAKGERALAIIRYAEKHGVPVVRDIVVARRLIQDAKRYAFIPLEMIEPIFRILVWLKEVEISHLKEIHPELQSQIDAAYAKKMRETESAVQPEVTDKQNQKPG